MSASSRRRHVPPPLHAAASTAATLPAPPPSPTAAGASRGAGKAKRCAQRRSSRWRRGLRAHRSERDVDTVRAQSAGDGDELWAQVVDGAYYAVSVSGVRVGILNGGSAASNATRCTGGTDVASYCMPGLSGPLCTRCEPDAHGGASFYNSSSAECASCREQLLYKFAPLGPRLPNFTPTPRVPRCSSAR